ncbi:MAG: preprotein translocase subunit SecD [Chloroflexota bacterium]|jgi:preprotein translocase subunit SecD|nr:preprotein translocase subunit SecD [Chloroflexota bacterium]
MRRFAPLIIVVIGLLALAIDFWPGLKLPTLGDPSAGPKVLETKLGLDLQGGLRVEYRAVPVGGKVPDAAAMTVIRDIIEKRVNSTGVSEPVVVVQGTDRVVVELPGATDRETIEQLIGTTGQLTFVPLPPEKYGTATSGAGPLGIVDGGPLPNDPDLKPLFDGTHLTGANPGSDQNTGQPVVAFTLDDVASKLFADYTRTHVNDFFAIVLDNTVISAPSIREPITSGSGQITMGTGADAVARMNALVTVLKYGSLPFPIEPVQDSQISATLGAEFLHRSLVAGGIGIGLVFLFMLVYYRLPGLVADLALIYYALVVLAIFRLIPVTLTLAGIAGFVLSVGMAVDANILIFERTKEELRLGKTLVAAVEAGFARAWNSILDSNVSSLITAGILYAFGSPTIKGFALVLIIGVLTSMFTAITVTRTILRGIVHREFARRAGLWGVGEEEFMARTPGRGPRPVRARV